MPPLFQVPVLDLYDDAVLAQVHSMRADLRHRLGAPRRWQGVLRRTLLARALQGSNSIEGYHVSEADAVAAVDHEEPLSADRRTWAEIVGYRSVMSYVLQAAQDPDFRYDAGVLRSMHFMLLSHDLAKSPGRYRRSSVYVVDEEARTLAYQAPDHELVPDLVGALMADLAGAGASEPLVSAAMAHLNLVMIHPFRDGNGRMARALQTLVLAREAIVEAPFASIEEWLGSNTRQYYAVLAATGGGRWQPERDAHLWVKFNLRAHHMQAQTVHRRMDRSARLWQRLEQEVAQRRLPARVIHALFDAATGIRVRRPGYQELAEVEQRTAVRDLNSLVATDLLAAEGATRGRYYRPSKELQNMERRTRVEAPPMVDPFPELTGQIAAENGRIRHELVGIDPLDST